MPYPHRLTIALGLHPGRQRPQNEDAVGYNDPTNWQTLIERGTLLVVADGVGGLDQGELASDRAVRLLIEQYYSGPVFKGVQAQLKAALGDVNLHLRQAYPTSATTIVAVVIHTNTLTVTHLGDSRAYVYQSGRLEQLTKDHVVAVQRPDGRVKNKLSQALGHRDEIEPEFITRTLNPGDRIILLSDGLTRYLDTPHLQLLCQQSTNVETLTQTLVTAANDAGGIDNISVITAEVGEVVATRAMFDKLLEQTAKHSALAEMVERPPNLMDEMMTVPVIPAQAVMPPRPGSRGIGVLLVVGLVLAGVIMFNILTGAASDTALIQTAIPSDASKTVVPSALPLATPAVFTNSGGDHSVPPALVEDMRVSFSEAAPVYNQISEDVTAFILDTGRIYRIHSLLSYENSIWIRLYDLETEKYGWIEISKLPEFRVVD